MAPSGAATVTIDRNYFETLLRRAKFVSGDDAAWPSSLPPDPIGSPAIQNADINDDAGHVNVSKAEYDGLVLKSRQYANLTRALMRGGIDEQTINLLGADEGTWPTHEQPAPILETPTPTQTDGGVRLTASRQTSVAEGGYRGYQNGYTDYQARFPAPIQRNDTNDWAECASHDEHSSNEGPFEPGHVAAPKEQEREPLMVNGRPLLRIATRTLILFNLPEGVTHGDITNVVRGGQLLGVFMRNDRSCTVSFVHGQDARIFYDHIKKNDLYLKNKRIEIKWSKQQFQLQGHVANKIRVGASRNLVVRRCGKEHTEETIRDDLEHIHNLYVIKVEFASDSCYIKTNSIHNAMFARTCMMSRFKYRGSKIEWDVDECAQIIEPVPSRPTNGYRATSERKPVTRQISNRFQALSLDYGDDDEQEQTTPGILTQSSVRVAF